MCAPRVTRHTSIRYSSCCHTRVNMLLVGLYNADGLCYQWGRHSIYVQFCYSMWQISFVTSCPHAYPINLARLADRPHRRQRGEAGIDKRYLSHKIMTLYYLQCDNRSLYPPVWYGYWFIDFIYSLLMYLILRHYSKFTGLCVCKHTAIGTLRPQFPISVTQRDDAGCRTSINQPPSSWQHSYVLFRR